MMGCMQLARRASLVPVALFICILLHYFIYQVELQDTAFLAESSGENGNSMARPIVPPRESNKLEKFEWKSLETFSGPDPAFHHQSPPVGLQGKISGGENGLLFPHTPTMSKFQPLVKTVHIRESVDKGYNEAPPESREPSEGKQRVTIAFSDGKNGPINMSLYHTTQIIPSEIFSNSVHPGQLRERLNRSDGDSGERTPHAAIAPRELLSKEDKVTNVPNDPFSSLASSGTGTTGHVNVSQNISNTEPPLSVIPSQRKSVSSKTEIPPNIQNNRSQEIQKSSTPKPPLPQHSVETKSSTKSLAKDVKKSSQEHKSPPSASEHAIDYLKGKVLVGDRYEAGFTTPHEDLCPNNGRDLKVLILITTAPDHEKHRNAIRQTWGSFSLRRDVALAFLVGRNARPEVQSVIDKENDRYGDIIEANFVDHYVNLTLKTVSMLEWAKTYCSESRFVLKTDDDMFINVPLLLAFIHAKNKNRCSIFGRLASGWKPIRNRKSKYYIDTATYIRARYPDFLTGPAYLLTNDVIEEMYTRTLQVPFFVLEDVLLTGFIGESLGIKRVGDSHFRNEKIKQTDTCKLIQTISIHMVKYDEQFDIYKRTLDGKSNCRIR